ncbi:hypothetical protein EDC04DRAFT_1066129 [Pisolithus marmoratus]|nr:hypothetical protein EDC04DRAFT_1066129 [Pisolithus marmoratus]
MWKGAYGPGSTLGCGPPGLVGNVSLSCAIKICPRIVFKTLYSQWIMYLRVCPRAFLVTKKVRTDHSIYSAKAKRLHLPHDLFASGLRFRVIHLRGSLGADYGCRESRRVSHAIAVAETRQYVPPLRRRRVLYVSSGLVCVIGSCMRRRVLFRGRSEGIEGRGMMHARDKLPD